MSDIPNAFCRATIKAIIRDKSNKVLVVKEASDFIDLPGGGIDHGESLEKAMARELAEEIDYHDTFTMDLIGVEVLERRDGNGYVLFVVYDVQLQKPYTPTNGIDSTEVLFVDPYKYGDRTDRSLQMIYKYGTGNLSAKVDYRMR